jgi:PadR family transcriptional regulator AphA
VNNQGLNKPLPQAAARNPAEWAVLGTLAQGQAHGYEVHKKLSEDFGRFWNLKTSRIYALLGRLEKEGLVSHQKVTQDNRPAKKIYRITDTGHHIFKSWVSRPVAHIRDMRLEFMAKLFFAGCISIDLERKLINDQKKVCSQELERIQQQLNSSMNFIDKRSLTFRQAILEAAIEWLEMTDD